MEKFNNEHKEEYNKEPVYYCKKCLSLKIGYVAVLEGSEYCEDCNSTNIGKAPIEEWDEVEVEKPKQQTLILPGKKSIIV